MWAEFTYDAYGLPQIHVPGAPDNTIAQAVQASIGLMLTPQLYRGYVYAAVGDMYTYYLGSRYYVPQLCRFFNADKHSDTQTGVLATNMFAYCNNNPVMNLDPKGESSIAISLAKTIGIGAIPAGLVGFAYILAYNNMLCLRLFQWSFNNRYEGHTYDFSSNRLDTKNWSSFIANKLKKSQVIREQIKEILKKMGNKKSHKEYYYGSDNPAKINFYTIIDKATWKFSIDDDLKWSIGRLSATTTFTIYVEKNYRVGRKTCCRVYCTLKKEKWDFDEIDDCDSFTDYLVNFGSVLEDDIKVTKPFYWEFSVAFTITV